MLARSLALFNVYLFQYKCVNISNAFTSGDCNCQRIDKRGSCRLSKVKLAYFFTVVFPFFITIQNKRQFDNNLNYMTRKHLQKESVFQKKRNLSSLNRLERIYSMTCAQGSFIGIELLTVLTCSF